MTSHEYARLLLSLEEKPLYNRDICAYDDSEIFFNYEAITGVNDDVLENAYIIKTESIKVEPNDKKYFLGDAMVSLEEKEFYDIFIDKDRIIYMLLTKSNFYYNSRIGTLSFFEEDDVLMLNKKIKISKSTSFNPEWIELDIEDAIEWYKEKMKNDCIFALT